MATLCQESIAVDLSSVDTNLNLQKASEDFQWRSIDSVLKTVLGRLTSASLTTDYCTVSGKSMGDIPSSYQIPALRHHERAVVGTYVHPDIVPGFKYCARANGTDEYIFDRQPMLLENIGQGYGKRLTFESDDILNNTNYFWSDSSPLGYAFSIHVIDVGTTFLVYENEQYLGTCSVTSVNDDQEIINSRNDGERMQHIKDVHVNFRCLFLLDNECRNTEVANTVEEFSCDVAAFVRMVKGARESRARTEFIHGLLLPSMKKIVLKKKTVV